MKKLAFVFAAIVAVSFASCGNKTTGTECADSTACAAEEFRDLLKHVPMEFEEIDD